MHSGTAASRVVIAGVVAGVVLNAAGAPTWLFVICAVAFAFGARAYIQRETKRDVGGR